MQPKKHKKTNSRPNRAVCLLTVPTEVVARWHYKTVKIVLPLNL